jgi:hypothetical protein
MSYDNTTLNEALDKWLKKRCNVGYGQVYCGDLQADFEDYCRQTGAMKASPGMIVFGREMTLKGFGRKRVNGMQYMTGLELKNPRHTTERRRVKRTQSSVKADEERKARRADVKKKISAEVKKVKGDPAVKRRMKMETKQRAIDAGKVDGA